MNSDKIERARERRKEIGEIIKEDTKALGLMKMLTFSAMRYVESTVNFEAQRKRFNDSERCVDDSADFIESLDREKRNAHESLISNLNVFNRYLFNNFDGKVPIGGIYSLEPPESIRDRYYVGDWAGYYVFGLKGGCKDNL